MNLIEHLEQDHLTWNLYLVQNVISHSIKKIIRKTTLKTAMFKLEELRPYIIPLIYLYNRPVKSENSTRAV